MPARCLVIALLTLTTTACSHAPAKAEEPKALSPRTVSVVGTATTRTVPDTIVWSILTTSVHRELGLAKEMSDRQVAAILKTARSLEVSDNDLQTGQLDVQREYERSQRGGNGAFKHFRVTRQLSVKQRDIEAFDRFLTGFVSSADLEVTYQLISSEIERIRHDTRLKAVKAARDKAEAMLAVLGESLGPVMRLGHTDESRPRLRSATNTYAMNFGSSSLSGGVTFAPGTIDVRVSVSAVFAIGSP